MNYFNNYLNTQSADFSQKLRNLLAYEPSSDSQIIKNVDLILQNVKQNGDIAVLNYAQQFDHAKANCISELEVSQARLKQALTKISPEQRGALESAAARLRSYAERQKMDSWEYSDEYGNLLGQKVTPLDRVGIYVPGGKAAYPSSVLMNAIPAKVAGVGEIIMCSPTPDGELNELVLAAAFLAGVDRVFALGGAHAIGALAYGTASIPAVDKITGPGNAYVAAAKRAVFGRVGIDMIAGPSEILVICDGKTHPDWIAVDLFSQAEHDETAQAILISPDAQFLDNVDAAMQRLLPQFPRQKIIQESIQKRGALILVQNLEEACELSNQIAPEHLELSIENPEAYLPILRHAGAIFMGRHTPEAFGDYCAGPNHVLPTAGTARFSSPLGVYDFQKRTSLIQASPKGAGHLGAMASILADGEGLQAHAESARLRCRYGA